MNALLSINVWLGGLIIFFLRLISVTMDTLRFMLVMRGKRTYAWILGFIESTLYILVIGSVLSNIDNVFNVIGYAAGFATGNVIGMTIEKRLAIGFAHIKVVSKACGVKIASALRDADYAVTEIAAQGKDGSVSLLDINVRRKNVHSAEELILKSDPEAFITVEEITPVRSGYWHPQARI